MDRRLSEFDCSKVETPATTPMPAKFGRLCLPVGNHHEVTCWVGATNDLLFATWGQPNHIDCFRQDGCSERVCQRILRFLRFEEVFRRGHGIVAEAGSVFVPFTEQTDFNEAKKVVGIGRSDTTGDDSLRLNGIVRVVSIDEAHFQRCRLRIIHKARSSHQSPDPDSQGSTWA
jgi:hypothetical protein